MNQTPLARFDLALDRRHGFAARSGHRSEARRRAASELRSASGRPISPGMTAEQRPRGRREEADLQVGVEEKRRDIGAVQHVLQVVGGGALPLQGFLSWLFSAVSSSLSDCNSSFEVSSSSLVDWYSSLTDKASSLIAFCSSLDISRLCIAPCSSVRVASSSCSSSATRGRSRCALGAAGACAGPRRRRRSRPATAPHRRSAPAARRC